MSINPFSHNIIKWYSQNKRDLPWRHTKNPYYIWLSEIILQQTRVAQGLPYYESFVKTFPKIEDLARASEQEILKLWQGLGYYSRARNLHFTAKHIVTQLNGRFPDNYADLLKLKGVGDYTASAISSFCFNEKAPTIDGNVYRVLARFFGIETPINTPKAKKEFKLLANELITPNQPALFNQAIMEFGALQCKPKQPDCHNCVLSGACLGLQRNQVASLPFKIKKKPVKKRYFNYLILQTDQNKTYIKKRIEKGIWQNLYEFPLIETLKPTHYKTLLEDQNFIDFTADLNFKLQPITETCIVHKLSHQHLYIKFWLLKTSNWSSSSLFWEEVIAFPFPIVIYNFIKDYTSIKAKDTRVLDQKT